MDWKRALFSAEPWNHPKLLPLVCGLSAGLGALVANRLTAHVFESAALQGVAGGLVTGLAVLAGAGLFALVD